MKILLIEDDDSLIALLTRSLTAQHHIVDAVKDGEMGWTYASTFDYDLIILDVMLPKLDGISLCQRLRGEAYTMPILLLTAQDYPIAKVRGLDAGADDCVVKPFDLAELIARVRALLRRSSTNPLPLLSWGDLMLDPSTCDVTYNGQPLTLTTKEYDLLELLLRDSYHVFSSDEIIDRLWSSDAFPAEATVRSHLRRLRHKLQAAGAPHDFISTIHGRGYYLKPPQFDLTMGGEVSGLFQMSPGKSRHEGTLNSSDLPLNSNLPIQFNQQQASASPNLPLLLLIDLEPNLTLSLTAMAKDRGLQTLVVSKIEAAYSYLSTLPDAPVNILSPTLVLVSLSASQEYSITSHPLLGFIHNVNQRFPHWSVLVLSERDGFNDRLAVVRHGGKFLCTTALTTDQIFTAATSLLQFATDTAKIMVVDDDLDWLRALPQLLQPWGMKVTTLADPQQFWIVLQAVQPDAVVLDVQMPEINGLELCQVLRSDPYWQHLPILFLSAINDPRSQQEAFSVGADDYLCKPVMGEELAQRIRHRLARIQAGQVAT